MKQDTGDSPKVPAVVATQQQDDCHHSGEDRLQRKAMGKYHTLQSPSLSGVCASHYLSLGGGMHPFPSSPAEPFLPRNVVRHGTSPTLVLKE